MLTTMNEKAEHSMKNLKFPQRHSYLLRLWRSGDFDWQASLERPETGERIGFASLEALFTYLMDLAEEPNAPPEIEVRGCGCSSPDCQQNTMQLKRRHTDDYSTADHGESC